MRRVALKDVCGCPFFGMSVREDHLDMGTWARGRRVIGAIAEVEWPWTSVSTAVAGARAGKITQ